MSWTKRLRRGCPQPVAQPPHDLGALREEDLTDGDRDVLATAYATYERTARAAREEADPIVAHYISSLAERVLHKGEEMLTEIAADRLASRQAPPAPVNKESALPGAAAVTSGQDRIVASTVVPVDEPSEPAHWPHTTDIDYPEESP